MIAFGEGVFKNFIAKMCMLMRWSKIKLCCAVLDYANTKSRYSSHIIEIKVFATNPKIWVQIAWVEEGAAM